MLSTTVKKSLFLDSLLEKPKSEMTYFNDLWYDCVQFGSNFQSEWLPEALAKVGITKQRYEKQVTACNFWMAQADPVKWAEKVVPLPKKEVSVPQPIIPVVTFGSEAQLVEGIYGDVVSYTIEVVERQLFDYNYGFSHDPFEDEYLYEETCGVALDCDYSHDVIPQALNANESSFMTSPSDCLCPSGCGHRGLMPLYENKAYELAGDASADVQHRMSINLYGYDYGTMLDGVGHLSKFLTVVATPNCDFLQYLSYHGCEVRFDAGAFDPSVVSFGDFGNDVFVAVIDRDLVGLVSRFLRFAQIGQSLYVFHKGRIRHYKISIVFNVLDKSDGLPCLGYTKYVPSCKDMGPCFFKAAKDILHLYDPFETGVVMHRYDVMGSVGFLTKGCCLTVTGNGIDSTTFSIHAFDVYSYVKRFEGVHIQPSINCHRVNLFNFDLTMLICKRFGYVRATLFSWMYETVVKQIIFNCLENDITIMQPWDFRDKIIKTKYGFPARLVNEYFDQACQDGLFILNGNRVYLRSPKTFRSGGGPPLCQVRIPQLDGGAVKIIENGCNIDGYAV